MCASDWGNETIKLKLPAASLPYTLRNAVEQFFAARAPVAFYGNSFSTFSKGVALMRGLRKAPSPSFAFDCAAANLPERRSMFVTAAHPGFEHLRPLGGQRQEAC